MNRTNREGRDENREETKQLSHIKDKKCKIDDHIQAAGIDNQLFFTDPTTSITYHRLKVLGKGGFAKGKILTRWRESVLTVLTPPF